MPSGRDARSSEYLSAGRRKGPKVASVGNGGKAALLTAAVAGTVGAGVCFLQRKKKLKSSSNQDIRPIEDPLPTLPEHPLQSLPLAFQQGLLCSVSHDALERHNIQSRSILTGLRQQAAKDTGRPRQLSYKAMRSQLSHALDASMVAYADKLDLQDHITSLTQQDQGHKKRLKEQRLRAKRQRAASHALLEAAADLLLEEQARSHANAEATQAAASGEVQTLLHRLSSARQDQRCSDAAHQQVQADLLHRLESSEERESQLNGRLRRKEAERLHALAHASTKDQAVQDLQALVEARMEGLYRQARSQEAARAAAAEAAADRLTLLQSRLEDMQATADRRQGDFSIQLRAQQAASACAAEAAAAQLADLQLRLEADQAAARRPAMAPGQGDAESAWEVPLTVTMPASHASEARSQKLSDGSRASSPAEPAERSLASESEVALADNTDAPSPLDWDDVPQLPPSAPLQEPQEVPEATQQEGGCSAAAAPSSFCSGSIPGCSDRHDGPANPAAAPPAPGKETKATTVPLQASPDVDVVARPCGHVHDISLPMLPPGLSSTAPPPRAKEAAEVSMEPDHIQATDAVQAKSPAAGQSGASVPPGFDIIASHKHPGSCGEFIQASGRRWPRDSAVAVQSRYPPMVKQDPDAARPRPLLKPQALVPLQAHLRKLRVAAPSNVEPSGERKGEGDMVVNAVTPPQGSLPLQPSNGSLENQEGQMPVEDNQGRPPQRSLLSSPACTSRQGPTPTQLSPGAQSRGGGFSILRQPGLHEQGAATLDSQGHYLRWGSGYFQRLGTLWSRWAQGVAMDDHSWSTVTPESVALQQAEKLKGRRVVDGMAGCGGNIVAFARHAAMEEVVAVDLSQDRLAACLHNARVYGCHRKVETICGSFLEVAATLEADSIFMSPPWVAEGAVWDPEHPFNVNKDFPGINLGLTGLIEAAFQGLRTVSDGQGASKKRGKLGFFLPRSTLKSSIVQCCEEYLQHLVQRHGCTILSQS
ncbi:hypothetical protein WJX73_003469 [Symbiochloris irregularis]|uniref:Trimethylguanosine synthase n=1 Tax=Symbiochloris irregularis TaxID=706552 RepID=A0AAW1PE89_9CHLO